MTRIRVTRPFYLKTRLADIGSEHTLPHAEAVTYIANNKAVPVPIAPPAPVHPQATADAPTAGTDGLPVGAPAKGR